AGGRPQHGVERPGPGSTHPALGPTPGPRSGATVPRYWQTRGMSATSLAAHAGQGVPARAGPPEPCVLLKLGEIVLKGGNRRQFEQLLHANIRQAMDDAGLAVRVWQRYGVIMLRAAEGTAASAPAADALVDRIAERAGDLMGVARGCWAVRVATGPAAAIATAVGLLAC